MTARTCEIEECETKHYAKGMCSRHYHRERAKVNPPDPEKLRAAQERYWAKPGSLDARRDNVRVRRYNITGDEYARLLERQGRCCAICKRHQSEFAKWFCVDHDHRCCPRDKSCGKCIRGLLCLDCNIGIGKLLDNVAVLQAAIDYLQQGPVDKEDLH